VKERLVTIGADVEEAGLRAEQLCQLTTDLESHQTGRHDLGIPQAF
jgi:hypothetical protein